ncbi:MAG TPA: tetratricopeptide repeat protein, partial [Burkholderiaceae bacterium]|nr:tetratricopeptide repeat protein [Burkholderiaceae bacterium]
RTDILASLGLLLHTQNQPEQAVTALQRAVALNPQLIDAYNNLGNALQDLKRFDEAANSYRLALRLNPDYAELHNNLGNALSGLGKMDEALACFHRALEIAPEFAEAHSSLGSALEEREQLDGAAESFRRALQIHPNYAEAHSNLGNVLQKQGQLEDAIACYRQALSITPNHAEILFNLGNALLKSKQLDDAATSYRLAIQIKPNYAAAYSNLGNVLREQKLFDDATASFHQAIALNPTYADAHRNLACLYKETSQFNDAVASFQQALKYAPDDATLYNDLGSVFVDLARFDDAMAHYRHALQINPKYAEAYYNQGIVLSHRAEFENAIASYKRAIQLKPDYSAAYTNLGNALKDLGQFGDAVESYRRALEIDADLSGTYSNLLFTYNYIPELSTAAMRAEAMRFGDSVARTAQPYTTWSNDPATDRRLRIGFVSGDFRHHPVGFFVEGFLAALASQASDRLELFAYPTSTDNDGLTERIKTHCHRWHSAVGLSDTQLAQQIRDDGIDILIDLSGHSAQNRLPMFAWKPAPVQVSWLGNLATTGVAAIDYVIADHWAVPPCDESHFTETIWRLSESCLCFTPQIEQVEVSPLPALTNPFVTFGSFNNLVKMNDAVVALWSRVLHAVPESRLFLKDKQLGNPLRRQHVSERFARHGIDADRLIFEGYAPRSALFSYHNVDIGLDPFPYSGVTTSVEALWMGVPVLTLVGDRFLSRIGQSILHNAGLPDWIATNADDYVNKAVQHASDLQSLANLRSGLRERVLHSPLFDAPRFAHHFEAALRGMWTQWCAQQQQAQHAVESRIH